MPVPFALLAAAIPGALQTGQALLNKPKKEDFRPNTAGMEKFIAHLRSKTARSEVAHQALQPQLRAIGAQNRSTERKIQSAVGRGNLSASEEAQLQISQGQQATSALQVAGEQATALQAQENRRVGEQVARVESQIAQAKEQAKIDFERAVKQNKQNVQGGILNIAGGVASAGIGDFLTKQATSKGAFDAFKASGLSGEFESASDLAKASVDAGFTNPQQFVNMLANQEKVKQSFSQFGQEEIGAASQKLFGTTEFDIGKDLSTGGAQNLLNELGAGRNKTVLEASQAIQDGTITDVSQLTSLPISDAMKLQLGNQLSTKESNLASGLDVQISNALSTGVGLDELAQTDGLSKTQLNQITRGRQSARNVQAKADEAIQKKLLENKTIDTTTGNRMRKFGTARALFENKAFTLSNNLDNAKDRAVLNDLLRVVDENTQNFDLSEGGLKNITTAQRAFLNALSKQGLSSLRKKAKLREDAGVDDLVNWLSTELRTMGNNGVTLTPEQIDARDRALLRGQ